MTLPEFLLARISEVEATLRRWATDEERKPGTYIDGRFVDTDELWLAECEAKRRIVTEHPWDEYDICTSNDAMGHLAPIDSCPVLRLLALPYADHPDYDERWRV